MLHQKADAVAASSAAKTFIDLLGRGNRERRGFFIMKWAQSQVIGSSFFQLYKRSDDLHNINAAENLLYGVLGNQNFDKMKM